MSMLLELAARPGRRRAAGARRRRGRPPRRAAHPVLQRRRRWRQEVAGSRRPASCDQDLSTLTGPGSGPPSRRPRTGRAALDLTPAGCCGRPVRHRATGRRCCSSRSTTWWWTASPARCCSATWRPPTAGRRRAAGTPGPGQHPVRPVGPPARRACHGRRPRRRPAVLGADRRRRSGRTADRPRRREHRRLDPDDAPSASDTRGHRRAAAQGARRLPHPGQRRAAERARPGAGRLDRPATGAGRAGGPRPRGLLRRASTCPAPSAGSPRSSRSRWRLPAGGGLGRRR